MFKIVENIKTKEICRKNLTFCTENLIIRVGKSGKQVCILIKEKCEFRWISLLLKVAAGNKFQSVQEAIDNIEYYDYYVFESWEELFKVAKENSWWLHHGKLEE